MYKKIKYNNITKYKLFGLTIVKKINEPYIKYVYFLGFRIYKRINFAKYLSK